MESGREASVHIQLEGRPALLEMVSLTHGGRQLRAEVPVDTANYVKRMVCKEAFNRLKRY